MPQVITEDADTGTRIPDINVRIIEGQKPHDQVKVEDAIFDYDTGNNGDKGWPIPYWPKDKPYMLHVNAVDINPNYSTEIVDVPPADVNGDYPNITVKLKKVSSPVEIRTGIVTLDGRALRDDQGRIRPLGCTWFWAMQAMKSEPYRVPIYIDYLKKNLGNNFVRILGEVDWLGWSIEANDPDWENNLGKLVDELYERGGMRTQLTLIGGQYGDLNFMKLAKRFINVYRGREHKFIKFEVVNEWNRLDKMTLTMMELGAKYIRQNCPNLLISLSAPEQLKEGGGIKKIIEASKRSGANVVPLHPRRTGMENGWDNVSQQYDADKCDPLVAWINEPVGPQSSVNSEMRPLFLAAARAVAIICSAPGYVFHPGQMVTGHVDPNHGRPAELWGVPNIEEMMLAVKSVEAFIPEDVENWVVKNNARDDHPLQLPMPAFWSDENYKNTGWVNKNYAAVAPGGARFSLCLMGVWSRQGDGKSVNAGRALYDYELEIVDMRTWKVTTENINAGETLQVRGMANNEAAYIINGVRR